MANLASDICITSEGQHPGSKLVHFQAPKGLPCGYALLSLHASSYHTEDIFRLMWEPLQTREAKEKPLCQQLMVEARAVPGSHTNCATDHDGDVSHMEMRMCVRCQSLG